MNKQDVLVTYDRVRRLTWQRIHNEHINYTDANTLNRAIMNAVGYQRLIRE